MNTRTTARSLVAAASLAAGLSGCSLGGGPALPSVPEAGGSSNASAASLPTGVWRLTSLRETGQSEVAAPADLFTAEFTADGRVSLRVDCNRCAGSYTAGATSLHLSPMACTRAYCTATAPLDSTYEGLLTGAETWSADGQGRLDVSSAAGVLHFQR